MTRRRWLLTHWALAPFVGVVLVADLAAGAWLQAATMAAFLGLLVIHERSDRWSYRIGWWQGVADVGEALHKDEAPRELGRLLATGPPEPWTPNDPAP